MSDIKGAETSDKYLSGDVVQAVASDMGMTPSVEEASFQARLTEQVNHRKLNSRQVQLTSIAGAIGAMLFVSIGGGLASGPICLLVGESHLISDLLHTLMCKRTFSGVRSYTVLRNVNSK